MNYIKQISSKYAAKNMGEIVKTLLMSDQVKVIHVVNSQGINDENYWFETAESIGTLAPMEEDQTGNKTGRKFTDIKYQIGRAHV